MKHLLLTAALLPALALPAAAQKALPATPVRPVVDTYFGQKVTDNYRWLEDTKSPETLAWLRAQADYTAATLDRLPGRDQLIRTFAEYDRLTAVRYDQVKQCGNRYFYRRTLPTDNVGKVYMREGKAGPEQLLFDPATFEAGKAYAVAGFSPSPNGKLLALGLQQGGAELSTERVLRVDSRALLPEAIPAVFGGEVSWLPDNSGFVYTPHNSADPQDRAANLNTQARLHRLGTAPAADPVLLSAAHDPAMNIRPEQYPLLLVDPDGSQLYGAIATVDNRYNAWLAPIADVGKPRIGWRRLADPLDSVTAITKVGSQFIMLSVKGAPHGRLLVSELARPAAATAAVLLPEGKGNITQLVSTKDFLFVVFSDGINQTARQYAPRTRQWADVPIPGSGTVYLEAYNPGHSNELLVYATSWNRPITMYDYAPATRQLTLSPFHVPATYPGVADLMVEEVEVPGHDGVPVPLSLIYKKGLKKDGSNVCFMTGYGAYGSSATPVFLGRLLSMLNQGVIIAVTHPRGGSEKGQAWYRAGYQTTKPNTWKDFISCGDYLVKNQYTSPKHLIGEGTSAGGILIGRALTERPDLFAAAISNVSCSNALRMENSPNGPGNIAEFGTVQDSVQSRALYEMDAFQHVRPGTKYPAVICVGGMNDPRVIVWQPAKLAAALQSASTSGKPVLLQVNYDNGHFTEDKEVKFRNFANMYAFALWQAGHPAFQPK